MGDEERRPYAASVRRPGGELPEGTDYQDELEGPPDYGPGARRISTAEMDAAALEARRGAKTERPAPLAGEEREAAVRECLRAVESHAGIYGAADLFVRELAVRLGCDIAEAEHLLDEEVTRRAAREG